MRLPIKSIVLYFLLALIFNCCSPSATTISGIQKIEKPNYIFILADDLGVGRFKVALDELSIDHFDKKMIARDKTRYSPKKAKADAVKSMPNLIRMANEGVYFNNAFASSPWCSPSRLSILTGQYPHRNRAWISNDLRASDITEKARFLSSNLKEHGYKTSYLGKWHLGNNKFQGGMSVGNHPMDKGFDSFWGFDFSGTRYFNSPILIANRDSTKTKRFLTDEITNRALTYLKQQDDDPFFLMVSYNAPHGPLDLTPFEYWQPFGDRKSYNRNDVINYEIRDTKSTSMINNYNAHIYAMDIGVGKIMDYLLQSGLDSNTIVVFASDHGASGFETTPLPANSPYRGYKGQYFEGSLRIPLMFWSPPHIKPKRTDALTMAFDIMPTMLSMSGLELGDFQDLDGKSLSEVLLSDNESAVHDHLVWAGEQRNQQGIENESPKLNEVGVWCVKDETHYLRHTYNQGFEMYQNYDVSEMNNLASETHKRKLYQLLDKYNTWFTEIAQEPIYYKHVRDEVDMSRMEILQD